MKKKKSPRKKAIDDLDKVFSLYIRKRDMISGWVQCFTCGALKPIEEMQCGHYVSRSHHSLRWDERNCHAQCVGCNIFKKGNMDEYAVRLVAMYGHSILEELNREKHVDKNFSLQELQAFIGHYRDLSRSMR